MCGVSQARVAVFITYPTYTTTIEVILQIVRYLVCMLTVVGCPKGRRVLAELAVGLLVGCLKGLRVLVKLPHVVGVVYPVGPIRPP